MNHSFFVAATLCCVYSCSHCLDHCYFRTWSSCALLPFLHLLIEPVGAHIPSIAVIRYRIIVVSFRTSDFVFIDDTCFSLWSHPTANDFVVHFFFFFLFKSLLSSTNFHQLPATLSILSLTVRLVRCHSVSFRAFFFGDFTWFRPPNVPNMGLCFSLSLLCHFTFA